MSCDEEERRGIPGLYADLSVTRRANAYIIPYNMADVEWRHICASAQLLRTRLYVK